MTGQRPTAEYLRSSGDAQSQFIYCENILVILRRGHIPGTYVILSGTTDIASQILHNIGYTDMMVIHKKKEKFPVHNRTCTLHVHVLDQY